MRDDFGLRHFLNTWQLWMGIAFVAQIAVVVGLVVVSNRANQTNLRVVREEARIRASADATYVGCVDSIPELARISRHLGGVNQLAAVVLANAKAVLDATAPSDPVYAVRKQSYERIRAAAGKIAAIRALEIPTKSDCLARRKLILVQGAAG